MSSPDSASIPPSVYQWLGLRQPSATKSYSDHQSLEWNALHFNARSSSSTSRPYTHVTSIRPKLASYSYTSPTGLLALPLELRLKIYEFSLAPHGHVHLYISPSWFPCAHKKRCKCERISGQLLKTCKQIRDEAQPILYNNVFHFYEENPNMIFSRATNENRGLQLSRMKSISMVITTLKCAPQFILTLLNRDLVKMVSLKRVNFTMFTLRDVPELDTLQWDLWNNIKLNAPDGCEVAYGNTTQEEQKWTDDYVHSWSLGPVTVFAGRCPSSN
ncbi:hypothetical protein M8818_005240 [Zalaria obscura]|uniref:Uncharacterized protein n=1 Tax=Zalaria obscura TaxID=2024903 RepID=A0ACC3SA39_9PEZI